jgi:hypothetical protein
VSDRIADLSAKLARIADARHLLQTDLWSAAWLELEQELLERLLKCGPEDEIARWKLQMAIEAVRRIKRIIENAGAGEASVVKELDILEGRKIAPIA